MASITSIGWALILFVAHLSTLATSNAHFDSNSTLRCHPDQAAALLQLKQSFLLAKSANSLPSWRDGTDCCLWEGVGCDASSGLVTLLDLSGYGLQSNGIHHSVFSLTSLQRLDLSMNYLGTTTTAGFGRLTLLTHLNLSNSGLYGQIPRGISKLVNLVSLDLSTRFIDESDHEIIYATDMKNSLQESSYLTLVANLSNLRELYLDEVYMTSNGDDWCKPLADSVPLLRVLSLNNCFLDILICQSLSRLRSLTVINLGYNFAIGGNQSPEFFMDFVNLSVLQLSNNNLQGWFPNRLFRLENLRVLDLSFNMNLSGHLPNFPSSLEALRIEGTNFSYVKPTSSSNFKSLKELGLDGKFISMDSSGDLGSILLSWIGDLRKLTSLTLSDYDFSSTMPSSIGNLKNLISLTMVGCNLTRPILSAIGSLTELQNLDILDCEMYSSMPTSIGNLTNLRSLCIDSSGFSGPMPAAIGSLRSLKTMEISGWEFSGSIPSTIGNLTKLKTLTITYGGFSGQLPHEIGQISELVQLSIEGCGISGRIPSSIVNLTQLMTLSLPSNHLSGEIPAPLFTLPTLRYLDLGWNQVSGGIQEFDVTSSSLEFLRLSGNELTGEFPKSFFQLTSLISLEMEGNNLVGSVDLSSFLRMRKLTVLGLSHNKLSVTDEEGNNSSSNDLSGLKELRLACCNITKFPSILTRLKDMSYLDLSCNKISGDIPNWIWHIGNGNLIHLNLSDNMLTGMKLTSYVLPFKYYLEAFDLSSNMLQGQIPMPHSSAELLDYSNNGFSSVLPNFTLYLGRTRYLSMSKNNISGCILHSICDSDLDMLDLSYNNFSGPIPSCLIESNYHISILNLRENHFEGMLPTNVTNCALETINLHGNKIKGQIPRALRNCKDLEVLDLGNNQIADTFPSWLGRLSNLRVLVLRSNHFYGPLGDPEDGKSGEHFSSLQIIDLASNNFYGNLHPRWFDMFKSMQRYNNTGQMMEHGNSSGLYEDTVTISYKGFDETFKRILATLTAIDLSENALEGSIPESIGKLVSLLVLNLSHNAFSGNIPLRLGGIPALESLDLSSNKLSGEIPQELTNLTFLSILNLSNNKLEGVIPRSRQFDTFENSSYEGNAGLCGRPLSKQCGSSIGPSEAQVKSSSEHVDIVLFLFVGVGFGVGFAAAILTKMSFIRRLFHSVFIQQT